MAESSSRFDRPVSYRGRPRRGIEESGNLTMLERFQEDGEPTPVGRWSGHAAYRSADTSSGAEAESTEAGESGLKVVAFHGEKSRVCWLAAMRLAKVTRNSILSVPRSAFRVPRRRLTRATASQFPVPRRTRSSRDASTTFRDRGSLFGVPSVLWSIGARVENGGSVEKAGLERGSSNGRKERDRHPRPLR